MTKPGEHKTFQARSLADEEEMRIVSLVPWGHHVELLRECLLGEPQRTHRTQRKKTE